MSAPAESATTYDLGFARWVYDNIDGGDKLRMCMQCGVCSGSCPIGTEMDYGPRKLFMMIRAGMKEAVLTSNTMSNCVLCYRCVVRCPRDVPVAYILQDLYTKAVEEGYAEADVIATPCPLCQQNVEMYQDAVNKKFGTNHNIPVVFYSQLMAVAFGMDAKEDAALNQNVIRATKLEKMAKK